MMTVASDWQHEILYGGIEYVIRVALCRYLLLATSALIVGKYCSRNMLCFPRETNSNRFISFTH